MTELLAPARRLDLELQSRPARRTSTRCRTCRRCGRNRCASAICRSMPPAARAPDNPLTNLKVRQAIWHAINRQDMADKLVQGGSRVPPAPCFPTPVRLRRRRRGEVPLRPGQGQGAAGRGGLPQRLRHRARDLRAADLVAGGDAELPAGGRHPRQDQPAAGRAGDPEGVARARRRSTSAAGAATRSTTSRRSSR